MPAGGRGSPMASSSHSSGGHNSSWVYLSFSRSDIEYIFPDPLCDALDLEAIHTWVCSGHSARLEQINRLLVNDIEDTWIAIVVLSRSYPFSDLCMHELAKLMDYRKHRNLVVKPVFYGMDPEEVRELFGTELDYREKYLKEDPENHLKMWREAVSEVCNLSGWQCTDPRYVYELVERIVTDVKAIFAVARSTAIVSRENICPPPSSLASSSQYQGREGFSQVYVSFLSCDVSYEFLSSCNRELRQISGDPCVKLNHSNIETIKDSRVAIIFLSKHYSNSKRCKEERKKIAECENSGNVIVRLVFYKENLIKGLWKGHTSLARILEIEAETVDRWMGVPENQLHLVGDGDYEKFVRWIVEDVQALLDNTPSHANRERSYDVFLSFRGPDSRHTIISHLYRAICQKGIRTFKDSPELEAGQKRSELFDAIRRSRIAIIMFSENYARSKWCLDELKLIMDLKEDNKLTVVPIFYRVSPEEVRLHGKDNNKKGCYQIAMEEMEKKYRKVNLEMVESWKKALWKAGDLVGFPLPEGKDEGNCIEEVIKLVMKLLSRMPLVIAPFPIGINARLEKVEPLLNADLNIDVRMFGIYGPGGVGKTTLSKAICNNIEHKFDNWCFLSKVRGTPLKKLQKRLLRELLCEPDLNVFNVDRGKTMIQNRLGNKRVLVILDDVDKRDQLDALAGAMDWFGKGSRIIITTRDIHVLNSMGVQCRYEVKILVKSEACDLFRYHASGGKPEKLAIDSSLIDQFLDYANGLPLALVVLGRFLCSRSASEWESILENLKQDPPKDIISVLKISFDELSKDGQEIFLDIACFFKGWDKDYVVKVLDGCGFQTTIIIKILVERCLLTIESGKFQMHDLLEVMGRIIARGKCLKDDEIPNRIWLYSDFYDILSKNMGQERCATKGILLNSVSEDQEPISQSTFGDFKWLRLLIVRKSLAVEGSLDFPSELRWFEWPKYAAQAIDFTSSRKLVGIYLQRSEIMQILGKDFKELKYLNLYNCKSLEALPNLAKSFHLEDLNLSGCEKLSRLDNSIGSHNKLVHLNLKDCFNITEVPSLLTSKDFKTINFSCCSKLHHFPVIKEKLLFLKELNLEKTAVKELPDSIGNLVAVKILNLNFCKDLSVIPSSIFKMRDLEQLLASGCPKLEMFPRKIERDSTNDLGFPNLVTLSLQYCNLKDVEFLWDLVCFETLKEVNLSGNVFTRVPECISEFKSLKQLWLSCCKDLVKLPEVPSAIGLHIMGCRNLQSLPSLDAVIRRSKFQLDLSDCPQLDLHDLDASLSLKEIRELQGSAEVIVARKSFPSWMSFQITDCHSNYMVPLPEGISEDDILGLALSVTFEVMRGRAVSKSKNGFSPEVSLMVGQYIKYPIYGIDHLSGAHTWFVYIPRRTNSDDYAAEINWSSITLGFEENWTRIENCGVKVVCRNELNDGGFMVMKIQGMMDYEYEYESDEEEETSP